MRAPALRGVIDRRILVNYRLDPHVVRRVLPKPFRPRLVRGYAIGGICLIRLKKVRPRALPLAIGLRSENAAHRIAVEWDDAGRVHEGVYVARRDTDSRLNTLAGGWLFPGLQHPARFDIVEETDRYDVSMRSTDGRARVSVVARPTPIWPPGSVFRSLREASAFFEAGGVGWSDGAAQGRFDGLRLACERWAVEPLAVEEARSSFFEDAEQFPLGSVVLDCALLMRGLAHEWHDLGQLCYTAADPRRAYAGRSTRIASPSEISPA